MRNLKKLGILTLPTVMSLGIIAPAVGATTFAKEQTEQEQVQIQVAQVKSAVTKNDLIKKFKEFFPDQFKFLNDSDFSMDSSHYFPDDGVIRYNLSFHKNIKGKQVDGDIGFRGEDLEIEHYYYEPANKADALFPAKVTKEEAKKVALEFLNKFSRGNEYKLNTNFNYYMGNQTITEPIRYSFSFVRTENQIPISDQNVQVTVLGNGEVVEFYRDSQNDGEPTYDDVKKILNQNEIVKKVKENLSVNLEYQIEFGYKPGDRQVNLVYRPTIGTLGVHALSGEWQTINGFTPTLPKVKEIELLTAKPMAPKQTNFSVEEAKAFAEKLLAVDSDKVRLSIESIDERKNDNGQEVISIQYMYEYRNGGQGTELVLDKQTGEIIQYHDIKSEVLTQVGKETESDKQLSNKEALNQAIKYLKEFSPSYLHHYAKPIEETPRKDGLDQITFSFPRVVDGILVSGDQISVRMLTDGSLLGINVDYQNIKNWPSSKEIISKEEATSKFLEQLSLDLGYVKEGNAKEDNNHYHLVYTPVFNKNPLSFLDANTGEWKALYEAENRPAVSHPSAEEELNFLIQAGILDVKDVNTFDADAPITKGEAIEVIMKSLTRFYDDYYSEQENISQSFENIKPGHPLYQVIERAVTMKILDSEKATFDLNAPLTKEELAVWYVRALNLELAAKNSSIYMLNFTDAKEVQAKYTGYVALANSLGLVTDSNNYFQPKQKVTYAQLAVSTFRLAHEVYDNGPRIDY